MDYIFYMEHNPDLSIHLYSISYPSNPEDNLQYTQNIFAIAISESALETILLSGLSHLLIVLSGIFVDPDSFILDPWVGNRSCRFLNCGFCFCINVYFSIYCKFIIDFVYAAIVSPAICDIIPSEKSPTLCNISLVLFHTGSDLILSSKS